MNPDQTHEVEAEWDSEAETWHHHCVRCGIDSYGAAPPIPCEPTEEHA